MVNKAINSCLKSRPKKIVNNAIKSCIIFFEEGLSMCGPVLACAGMFGCVWAYVGMWGRAWACVGICGHMWACVGMHWCVRECFGIRGHGLLCLLAFACA
jgi:hypothetical protein